MSKYTNYIGVKRTGGIEYELTEDLVWHIGHVTGPEYRVPKGFKFDVSIPKMLQWLFNPHERAYHKAAAMHDDMLNKNWSRITAGAEFYDALKADGVKLWRRVLMFLGVVFYRYD